MSFRPQRSIAMKGWSGILKLLTVVALGILIAMVAYLLYLMNNTLDFSSFNDSAHNEARAAFLASLEGPSCLTRDSIIAAAQASDFLTREVDDLFSWCHRPTGLHGWIGVEIEPVRFMSNRDENTEFFGFDQSGCSVPWHYASGEGTTCP
ncbi:hypothetical protein [Roseinatronobacter monicus]|uniref:Uncharacterized protein n=1 Tax=Roseinatronobacter monicus TaxID=393481 RepID=A0A543KIL4_9RHOB|nr:hypothetical protein [Roseinatronobacter monicus]TQM94925.1 hypothetical protein BD293_3617 [Roseinatronobacter monicus]